MPPSIGWTRPVWLFGLGDFSGRIQSIRCFQPLYTTDLLYFQILQHLSLQIVGNPDTMLLLRVKCLFDNHPENRNRISI